MTPETSRADLWDKYHRLFETTGRYQNLSGYGLDGYQQTLRSRELVQGAERILEIGAGTGAAIKDLVAKKKRVFALDVSPLAVERAEALGAVGIAAPTLLPADYFDLALCHLVAQHVPDEDFIPLLANVMRSLRSGGALAIQAADVPGAPPKGFDFTAQGNILRSESRMTELLKNAGAGEVTTVSKYLVVPEHNVWWLGFHAVKP